MLRTVSGLAELLSSLVVCVTQALIAPSATVIALPLHAEHAGHSANAPGHTAGDIGAAC